MKAPETLGVLGEREAEDAAAVELDEGEDVADGLVAEAEAAALVVGQALGRGVGVEGGELQAAAGDVLELEVALAVAAELRELGAGPSSRTSPRRSTVKAGSRCSKK